MPQFRNKTTGAVITANGPVADDYSQRSKWEQIDNNVNSEPIPDAPSVGRSADAKEPASTDQKETVQ